MAEQVSALTCCQTWGPEDPQDRWGDLTPQVVLWPPHVASTCPPINQCKKKNDKERKPGSLTQADQWLHENFSHEFWPQSMFHMWWCSISNNHILADEFILSLHFLLQSIISESCKIFVCECVCTRAHVCGVYTYMSTCEDQRSAWWSQILFPTLIT